MRRITVIGAGPGGYEAAIYAAKKGYSVTLVEKEALGGTCMNKGCIPTKALLAVSDVLHTVQNASKLKVQVPEGSSADFQGAYQRKDQIVAGLNSGIAYLMQVNGVRVLEGTGSLVDAHHVLVKKNDGSEETVEADEIILATGSVATVPRMFPYDGKIFVSSDEVLSFETPPESIVIVGGGVIGSEIGQFLSRMGTKVTIVEMMPHLLPNEDADVVKPLEKIFKREKITVLCGKGVTTAEIVDGKAVLMLEDGTQIEAPVALIAIGRRANTSGLNLEAVGVELDERGYVKVDEQMRSSVPNIYAIGDIVRTPQLAHVASYEAFVAVDAMGGETRRADYRAVPRCVYTEPEIGAVGMTEEQLKKQGAEYKVGSMPFMALGKAKATGHTDGFAKILVDAEDRIVGGAVVGERASEVVQELTIAIAAGMTAKQYGEVICPHPSISESLMEAAHDVHGWSVNKG